MHMKTILVTGATGKQGGAVARALLKYGQNVRCLTRKPETAQGLARLGAQIIKGDFNDLTSLEYALRGVDGVYAMSTPFEGGVEGEAKQGAMLADVASVCGVRHFVYTSVVSAKEGTGIPHFESKAKIEKHIQRLDIPWTLLRPVFFMENFGQEYFMSAIKRGRLIAPLHPETELQMISLKDIGEFGAAAFIEPERFMGREIELAGDALTFPEVARILSKVLGYEVDFEQIPDDQAQQRVGRDMALMYRWFNEKGPHVDIERLRKTYGIHLTKFRELADALWGKVPVAA